MALFMIAGVFSAAVSTASAATLAPASFVDPTPEYVSPEFREQAIDLAEVEAAAQASGVTGSASVYATGEKANYYVNGYGTSSFVEFEKRGESSMVEVWVASDLSFPEGDPRNDVASKITIYDWQIDYLMAEFEDVIYPIESDYFGEPAFHDGSNAVLAGLYPTFDDESGKLMIMVWNFVDESYYDPTYPSYTVGYYSPTIEYYYDRNVIHIDSYDWSNRIGANVSRPYVYESTIAHEYQHLLHDDLDEDEVSFINEGCSMYSEMLCNYGEPWGYIEQFLFTPDNSLTEWGDQGDINIIADYGAAAMFAIYLNDHFGGADFMSALAHNTANGEEGVTDTLLSAGYADWDFDRVYQNWIMANMIHSDDIGNGWYNYNSIDLNDPQAGELTTLKIKPGTGFVTQSYAFQYTYTQDGYNTGKYLIGPYGTDYMYVSGTRVGELSRMYFGFDGNDFYEPGWKYTAAPAGTGMSGNVWYSGSSDERDVAIVAEVDLTAMTTATLSFDTYYNIEEFWDFGFVQVSTDDGATWTSLTNEMTTDALVDEGYPAIADELPGLTGTYSGPMSFDLSAYTGQVVLLSFRYMTDWGYTEVGWYVDNIAINGVAIENGDDKKVFESLQPPEDVDFTVTIYAPSYRGLEAKIVVLDPETEMETLSYGLADFAGYKDVYIVVTCDAGPTNYKFGLLKY